MRHVLSIKRNGVGGELITLCLLRDDNTLFHVGFIDNIHTELKPEIATNVVSVINNYPINPRWLGREEIKKALNRFIDQSEQVTIVTDEPEDLWNLRELSHLDKIKTELVTVKAFPTEIPDAVEHNCVWHAMALRHKLDYPNGMENEQA